MAEDKGLILKGDIRMATVNGNGAVVGGFSDIINVTQLEISQPTVETKVRTSRQRATDGQALDSVNKPSDPAKVTIQFDSLPAALLAEALAGTSAKYTVTGAAVTEEAVTLSVDSWTPLAHQMLTSGTVSIVDAATGEVELEEGEDFKVDYDFGMVIALKVGAAIAVKVDYTYASQSGQRVLGATEIDKPRQIQLVGTNLATGRRVACTIFSARLSANEAVDLMKDDFITGSLTGSLVTPSGKSAPYQIDMAD